jgi:hypothetical protein
LKYVFFILPLSEIQRYSRYSQASHEEVQCSVDLLVLFGRPSPIASNMSSSSSRMVDSSRPSQNLRLPISTTRAGAPARILAPHDSRTSSDGHPISVMIPSFEKSEKSEKGDVVSGLTYK